MIEHTEDKKILRNSKKIEEVVRCISRYGFYESNEFVMLTNIFTPEVWVRHVVTGKPVAYSSTESDRQSSIEEFAEDYFT